MNIELTKAAVKSIARLDKPTKHRIRDAIAALPSGDIKKLKGFSTSYRLRIGDYRVIFNMAGDNILINDVLPRGDAYK